MSDVLIEPGELNRWFEEGQAVTILDCRTRLNDREAGRRLWQEGRIPGSRHLDLDRDMASTPGERGRHPLPSPKHFTTTLQRLGVDEQTPVVVYDDCGGQLAAARAWWMLACWANHPRVSVLDGGLDAWREEGFALNDQAIPVKSSDWQPEFDPGAWVDADQVASSSALKLDVRGSERFRGDREPMDPKAGHIPGALNRPGGENLRQDGRFKSPGVLADELSNLHQGSGIGQDSIVYCGSGVAACHTILACAVAGKPLPKLYVGSWSEWSQRPERGIATGD
ncbi:sulfurtransferase [Pistricoccus aurantiacus]|uniref:sulfurtransferase n=1 Tax=Pistricoccus aurantiacus TaxID=1883414 RepID=UPI00362B20AA